MNPANLLCKDRKWNPKLKHSKAGWKKQKENEKKQVLYTLRNFPLKLAAKSTSSGSLDMKQFFWKMLEKSSRRKFKLIISCVACVADKMNRIERRENSQRLWWKHVVDAKLMINSKTLKDILYASVAEMILKLLLNISNK